MMCSVVVEQTRQRAFALEVDAPGAVSGQRQNFLVIAHGHERPALTATALAVGLLRSSVVDLAVKEDGVWIRIGHGSGSLVFGCRGVAPQ